MTDKKRVLVTGSTGFIGTSLCAHLSDLGYHVVGLDIEVPQGQASLDEFVHCDILDPELLPREGWRLPVEEVEGYSVSGYRNRDMPYHGKCGSLGVFF